MRLTDGKAGRSLNWNYWNPINQVEIKDFRDQACVVQTLLANQLFILQNVLKCYSQLTCPEGHLSILQNFPQSGFAIWDMKAKLYFPSEFHGHPWTHNQIQSHWNQLFKSPEDESQLPIKIYQLHTLLIYVLPITKQLESSSLAKLLGFYVLTVSVRVKYTLKEWNLLTVLKHSHFKQKGPRRFLWKSNQTCSCCAFC